MRARNTRNTSYLLPEKKAAFRKKWEDYQRLPEGKREAFRHDDSDIDTGLECLD